MCKAALAVLLGLLEGEALNAGVHHERV